MALESLAAFNSAGQKPSQAASRQCQRGRGGCSMKPLTQTDPITVPGFSLDIGSPPFSCWTTMPGLNLIPDTSN